VGVRMRLCGVCVRSQHGRGQERHRRGPEGHEKGNEAIARRSARRQHDRICTGEAGTVRLTLSRVAAGVTPARQMVEVHPFPCWPLGLC